MILDYLYKARSYYIMVRNLGLNKKLYRKKKCQYSDFNRLRNNFAATYKKIGNKIENNFTLASWRENNINLSQDFLPYPPFNFLQNPIIMRTMFVTAGGMWFHEQLKYLESRISEKKLKLPLEEDLVGGPLLSNAKYLTSHNSVHHLYHLIKFLKSTGYSPNETQIVVEWGAGYGNFAKIFKRYYGRLNLTYIMIDTAMFSSLQWLYLSTIFGKDQVHIIKSKKEKIKKGKINVLPVGLIKYCKIKADLFVSTWALSESSKYAQEFVILTKWFHAKNILMAFQKSSKRFPYANDLSREIKKSGGVVEEILFLPDNYYGYLGTKSR